MGFFDDFKDSFNMKSGKSFFENAVEAFSNLNNQATEVNKKLLLNRDRILEITTSIADSAPEVIRLGGEVRDVIDVITEASEAVNRSLILSSDQISRLYASQNLIGISVSRIVESFTGIGRQISTISDSVEKSINYVQSIGGNAKTVMQTVVNQMDEMNKFNFEDGVMGFTRMAAKASMLKIDMGTISSFAEKLADPQQAIEMASTFQRLGVAAGSLVDPFSLMYKSINDPEGLQDSIIDLTKRFVDFNSETGDFKINPAGILQMRELSSAIGMSYREFAKTAIAAADLDKRISEISFDYSGDKEDLMLLANMAQFKGGQYVVTIDNKEKSLSEVTESEFKKLKEIQANAPKTLEDISRNQLTITEVIAADLKAIAGKILYGISSTPDIQQLIETIRRGENVLGSSAFEATPTGKEFRALTNQLKDSIGVIGSGVFDSFSGTLTDEKIESVRKASDNIVNSLEDTLQTSFTRGYDAAISKFDKLKPTNELEAKGFGMFKDFMVNNREFFEQINLIKSSPSNIDGKTVEKVIRGDYDLKFNGEIKHKIDVPIGLENDDVNKIMNKTFNSEEFRKKMFDIIDQYNQKYEKKG